MAGFGYFITTSIKNLTHGPFVCTLREMQRPNYALIIDPDYPFGPWYYGPRESEDRSGWWCAQWMLFE